MKNLQVKLKFSLLVAFMVIAIIVMGFIAINSMEKINDGSTELADNWLPSVVAAEELNANISDYRLNEYAHILSDDAAMMQNYESILREKASVIQALFSTYDTLVTTEVDKKIVADAQSAWAAYLTVHQQALELSRQGRMDEAVALLRGESQVLFDNASTLFLELVDFNSAGGEAAGIAGTKTFENSKNFMYGNIAVVCVISLILAILILMHVLGPIREIDAVARQIAEGNLDVSITYKSRDELGVLAVNFNKTVDRLREYVSYIDEVSSVLNEISAGNLVFELRYDYTGEFAKVKTALMNISDSLNQTMTQINQSSDQVASGSDQVASGAQALSQGATEQASSIQELSATITEISHHIRETAQNAQNARSQTEQTGSDLMRSNAQMQEMIQAMNQISGKSTEISKIIKTIEDIAFQTNILALNAAVEAARAGAAGKGFAVVADEVRNLAGKSAEAAKTTTVLIEETVHAVENGTHIAGNTATAMLEVVSGAQSVTTLIASIADASEEQARSIEQVTQGVEQISSVVQTNSATAEESAAASEELSAQAQTLKSLVSKFKLRDSSASGSSHASQHYASLSSSPYDKY